MTVIAFDGRTIAADRQAVCGQLYRTVQKLYPIYDEGTLKAVLACNGDLSHGLALVAWWKAGANPNDWPKPHTPEDNAYLTVFRPGHKVVDYEAHPFPSVWEDDMYASGSGKVAAMAAMRAGADARRAVEITNEIIEGCGNGVDVVELYGDTVGVGRIIPA